MAKKISNKQLIKIIKDDFQEPYKHEWEQVAECIVTDQVPASDIAKFFQTKHFINFIKRITWEADENISIYNDQR